MKVKSTIDDLDTKGNDDMIGYAASSRYNTLALASWTITHSLHVL